MQKFLLAIFITLSSGIGFSQTFLIQENFSGGIPAGWQVIDGDGYSLDSTMTQFTSAWISYDNGTDTTVASSSYFNDTLVAADYLILPKQSLTTFSKLSWEARSVDASHPDGYYVLLSTTDSNLTSFTDTLMTVLGEYFIWNRKSLLLDTMGYANQDVFIAFQNNTYDGFILELDDIWLEVSDFASIEKNELDFVIYPNPSSDLLNIKTTESISSEVYNLQGSLILSSNKTQIDISNLSPGQYYIVMTSNAGSSTKPFIKQ